MLLVTFLLECMRTLCRWRKLWSSKTQPQSVHWTVEEVVTAGPLLVLALLLAPLGFLYGLFLL